MNGNQEVQPQPQQTPAQPTTNAPEHKIKIGCITATIWANRREFNGKQAVFKTIALERSYKDKEGNWQNTSSFRVNDLPKLQLVTTKAYEYLLANND